MKFEEALPLLREGKSVFDKDGWEWKYEGERFTYSHKSGWTYSYKSGWLEYAMTAEKIMGEWTMNAEYKCQYLFRIKGQHKWHLLPDVYETDEEAKNEFLHEENVELRRIEP
jgi:hypothetical protein